MLAKYRFYALLLCLGIFIGACSAERKFKVLSFFFDGVPEPSSQNEAVTADSVRINLGATGRGRRRPVQRVQRALFLHPPFQEKACDTCHSAGYGNRLIEEPPDLCYSCHEDNRDKWAFLHGPVAAGLCTTCHNPHSSAYPKLLFAQGQDVCFKCHQKTVVFANEVHDGIGNEACTSCHNPHGGDEEYFLE